MNNTLPNRITFQWHLTDKCNYRCEHCYQDSFSDNGLSFSELIETLDKLDDFVKESLKLNEKVNAHINFTGGEPFLRDDFLDLLEESTKRMHYTFGILSNGYLLNDKGINRLKKLKPKFVQISLEGNRKINNSIRGNGAYNDIIKALKTYKKHKIPVMISFTANSKNYKYFRNVVKVARKYNAFKVWTDRYLPLGENDELMLSTEQTQEFFQIILNEQKRNKYRLLSKTTISSNRALQFLVSGGVPYKCSAGNTLITILPNGDILPCRRLPVKVGNIKSDNLVDVYQNNEILKNLRDTNKIDEHCIKCYYKDSCSGGLKCLSYAKSKNIFVKDPNCWI
jgi:radical SAM protein with 4Fe4S-binding SPASM domain